VFESVKARLDRLFRDHTRSDPRARAAALRDALLEAKVGLRAMRDALGATQRELEGERHQLEAAERRGRLAAEVPDSETVSLAQRFAARHRERVAVLERKLVVQRDELALAEREVTEMMAEYRAARPGDPSQSIDAAWRDLEAAGADRPGSGLDDEPPGSDEHRRQQAIEAQLAFLKKKFGK
jgi:multidrug resistance efflux pump